MITNLVAQMQRALSKGESPELIERALLKQGEKLEDIDEALAILEQPTGQKAAPDAASERLSVSQKLGDWFFRLKQRLHNYSHAVGLTLVFTPVILACLVGLGYALSVIHLGPIGTASTGGTGTAQQAVVPQASPATPNVASTHAASNPKATPETITSPTAGPVPVSSPTPQDVVTPEQYGAVGNGVHDDTAAVQAAVNAAAGKLPVWLGAGKTYVCNSTILLPSNTTLEGAGTNSELKFTWFDAQGSHSGGNPYLGNKDTRTGDTNITLTNFQLVGATDGLPSGPNSLYPNDLTAGIRLRTVDRFSITHVEVSDTPAIAITYQGSQNGTLEYNYIHNSGRDGITGFWYIQNLSNIVVSHNYIAKVGDDGIAINGLVASPGPLNTSALPTNIQITDNTIAGWSSNPNGRSLGRGIALNGVNGVLVKDNSVNGSYSAGILVGGCISHLCPNGTLDPSTGQPWRSKNVQVLNNSITNAGQLSIGSLIDQLVDGAAQSKNGLDFYGTDDSTASGNTITNSLGAAVDVTDCNDCTIQSD
jgi:hypothetical protein